MMTRRHLGEPRRIAQETFASDVKVSRIVLGTMRLPAHLSITELSDLLCRLHELGIDTHHSSSEYETHGRYCEALRLAKGRGYAFKHIVKLAEPSWDDLQFSQERFAVSLAEEAAKLSTTRIDVVQWMVRTKDPTNDDVRLRILADDHHRIAAAFNNAKASGHLGAVACFGYTDAFLRRAAATGLIDGITGYYNSDELNGPMFAHGLPILGIRPFGGGQLLTSETSAADLIRFALKPAEVRAVIVSISSVDHAQSICDVAA